MVAGNCIGPASAPAKPHLRQKKIQNFFRNGRNYDIYLKLFAFVNQANPYIDGSGMPTTRVINWKTPSWLFWLAAPFAPLFIAMGALLCVFLTMTLGHDQSDQRVRQRPAKRRR
jgi:hypothetical protein